MTVFRSGQRHGADIKRSGDRLLSLGQDFIPDSIPPSSSLKAIMMAPVL